MNRLKFLVYSGFLFSIICLQSCQKNGVDDDSQSKIIKVDESNFYTIFSDLPSVLDKNDAFIQSFILKSESGSLTSDDFLKLNKILGIKINMDLSAIHNINILNNAYLPIEKQLESRKDCKKLLEIRNAMIKECESYIAVIEQACSGAVMIAYWYHSEGC